MTIVEADFAGGRTRGRARREEIAALRLTSAGVGTVLQETAAGAAAHFGLPVGLVSIVLDDARHFAALHGPDGWMQAARGTPAAWSFCRYAVAWHDAFVVEDTRRHQLAHDDAPAAADGIGCYAGHPLVTSAGHAIGALCVVGTEPRTFSDDDLTAVRDFAHRAVARIEALRAG